MNTEISLPQLRIASPCPASWDDMIGDEKVRHCRDCNLNVYNFVEMQTSEIAAILEQAQGGRVCAQLYQRADGTVLTADCPVGFARVRRNLRRMAGAVAAGVALLFSASLLMAGQRGVSYGGNAASKLSRIQPIAWLLERFKPNPPLVFTQITGALSSLGYVSSTSPAPVNGQGGSCTTTITASTGE